MGFKVNWVAVRGRDSDAVCRDMGLRRSGIRSDTPKPQYSGAELSEDCFLLVEDTADELVEDTWDLARISRGCEVIGFSVIESVGHSEVVGWRDGRRVWGVVCVPDDDPCLLVEGELPVELHPALAELRAYEASADDPEDIDYQSFPTYLAELLVGYRYDRILGERGEERFEVLDTEDTAEQLPRVSTGIVNALAEIGFRPRVRPDDYGMAFSAAGPAPGTTRTVVAYIERGRHGGVRVSGRARLTSTVVDEVLAAMPKDAWPTSDKEGDTREYALDSVDFGAFEQSFYMTLTYGVRAQDGSDGVKWFMDRLRGPVTDWYDRRGTLAKIAELAKQPNKWGAVLPHKVRTAVALAAACGDAAAAADLMTWYLDRDDYAPKGAFGGTDSRERATAFDRALAARFPDYARHRPQPNDVESVQSTH